jgi:hypothetical protein
MGRCEGSYEPLSQISGIHRLNSRKPAKGKVCNVVGLRPLLHAIPQLLAFLVRARVAELLDNLCRSVVQPIEVVSLLLRHAASSVTVDAADSSVQIPANTISHWVHFHGRCSLQRWTPP